MVDSNLKQATKSPHRAPADWVGSQWDLDRSKQREGKTTSDSALPTNQPYSTSAPIVDLSDSVPSITNTRKGQQPSTDLPLPQLLHWCVLIC
ncbi:hypothetical protein PCASD_10163 [Puccinia coronata f. sp. avenae]|uniref:Uncharacterized protein n=1 Tax=Puccinia coronata f. sp. avenae TaxID=200324 RepID=A0A2N5SE73_9BASI|nr:hypothetical protein PCASD_22715 [Puccinia coronata f. sp. avenae]PLW36902.1 hypothetical protein PCASD_10163 [Puccinia coronata f. sp. avenae]